MKLFIMTDIHGSYKYASLGFKKAEELKISKIILLGDILYHGPRNDLPEEYAPRKVMELCNNNKEQILAVKGNCDAEIDEEVLDFPLFPFVNLCVDGVNVLFTHGNHLDELDYDGNIIHGHIHISNQKDNIFTIGSISIPKDGHHAYGVFSNKTLTVYDLLTDEVIYQKVF